MTHLSDCVKFYGAFELALRGDEETSEPSNAGVFRGLIYFISQWGTVMKEHFASSTVVKGMSNIIQSDNFNSISFVCHKELSDVIKNVTTQQFKLMKLPPTFQLTFACHQNRVEHDHAVTQFFYSCFELRAELSST